MATPQRNRARKKNSSPSQSYRWKPLSLGFGLRLPGGASGAVASLAAGLGVHAAGLVVAKPDNGWRVHWTGPWGPGKRADALESGKRAVLTASVVHEGTIAVPIYFQGRCVAAVVLPDGAVPTGPTRELFQATGVSAILREAAFEMLAWESQTDALTGLANPRNVRLRIDEAAVEFSTVALMMIDVDHFRLYNEKWGHEAGNKALIEVARGITRAAGPRAIVGRYGGEEFVIAIPDCSRLQCVRIAERIRSEVKSANLPEGKGVTASIGCAILPDDGAETGSLISAADSAMYRAKRNGRDRVEVYSPGFDDPTGARLAGVTVLDLAEALRTIQRVQQEVVSASRGHTLDDEQVRYLVASRLLEGEGPDGAKATDLLVELASPRPRRRKKSA
ncbi:MAG: GGDEF domain-containing protein [Fimbriimonadaceae bacterium]|nr:GGDEF domain-containing protein [Fimbriimonadaceae bacterium]